jgi:hypothetical protein
MGLFSSGRGPRSFDYEPQYHDPDDEDDRELKRRMQSQRALQVRRSPYSLYLFLGLLLITILLYQAI